MIILLFCTIFDKKYAVKCLLKMEHKFAVGYGNHFPSGGPHICTASTCYFNDSFIFIRL